MYANEMYAPMQNTYAAHEHVLLPPMEAIPDFVAGLIYGFTGHNHLAELQGCFEGTQPMLKEVKTALDDFKHFHFIDGVKDIGAVIWMLPDSVQHCEGIQDDIDAIEEWADIFHHPLALVETINKRWIFHGTEVKEAIHEEQADWASGNWFNAGDDTAAALVDLLGPIRGVHHLPGPHLPPLNALPDFASGLIYGLTGHNHLIELQHCFQGGDDLIHQVEVALNDFKHLKFITGVQDIGQVIWMLPDAVKTCEGMDDDIAAIEDWAEIFHHPVELTELVTRRWLLHGTEVKEAIHEQQEDWHAERYFDAGDDAAAALVDLLGPIRPAGHHHMDHLGMPPLDTIPPFAAGLIYGLTGHNHLDELTHCFDGSHLMMVAIGHVIDDIKGLDLISAAKDIGNVIWMLPDAVKSCDHMDDDIDAIKQWADIFKHPIHLTERVAERWLTHGEAIKTDIKKEQHDWATHQYFEAGDDTAAALVELLGPIEPGIHHTFHHDTVHEHFDAHEALDHAAMHHIEEVDEHLVHDLVHHSNSAPYHHEPAHHETSHHFNPIHEPAHHAPYHHEPVHHANPVHAPVHHDSYHHDSYYHDSHHGNPVYEPVHHAPYHHGEHHYNPVHEPVHHAPYHHEPVHHANPVYDTAHHSPYHHDVHHNSVLDYLQ